MLHFQGPSFLLRTTGRKYSRGLHWLPLQFDRLSRNYLYYRIIRDYLKIIFRHRWTILPLAQTFSCIFRSGVHPGRYSDTTQIHVLYANYALVSCISVTFRIEKGLRDGQPELSDAYEGCTSVILSFPAQLDHLESRLC